MTNDLSAYGDYVTTKKCCGTCVHMNNPCGLYGVCDWPMSENIKLQLPFKLLSLYNRMVVNITDGDNCSQHQFRKKQ